MRKISANYIFPVISPPLKNGIISLMDDGTIIEVTDTKGQLKEISGLEFYNGAIIPCIIIPDKTEADFNITNAFNYLLYNIIKNKSLSQQLLFDSILYELTIKNARKLNINNIYGSIEPGKRPGLLLIENFNFEKMDISENSYFKILVQCRS